MTGADRPKRPTAAIIGQSAAVYCALFSGFLVYLTFAFQDYAWFSPDFSVFWTAGDMVANGRLADVYDWQAVTDAHPFEIHPGFGLRPWVYPPPALIPARALAALPMWTSFGLWVAFSALIYSWVIARCWPQWQPWAVILCLLSWPVHSALNTGQSTLVLAAAVIAGLASLEHRPVRAGTLFALAALIKPSLLVLAPLVMIAGGHWRALWASIAVGVTGLALTTLIFGIGIWRQWIGSLDGFTDYIVTLGIHNRALTLRALADLLSAPDGVRLALQLIGIVLGCLVGWMIFRRTTDLALRLIGLIGGGILVAPYAMHYDMSFLVPAAAAMLVWPKREPRDLIVLLPALAIIMPLPPVTAVCALSATLMTAAIVHSRSTLSFGPVQRSGA